MIAVTVGAAAGLLLLLLMLSLLSLTSFSAPTAYVMTVAAAATGVSWCCCLDITPRSSFLWQMVYVSECPPDAAGMVLSALAESVVSPKIVPWEMSDASVSL